jgi:hypothetical protein
MLSLSSKHVQYVKIYLACNFEVNLITHLGIIALFSGSYIDAYCQVWFHLAKLFQRRRFLEIDQSETRIACGGHVLLAYRN